MKIRLRMYCVSCLVTLGAVQLSAQTYHWIHSSENDTWQQSTVRLKSEVNTLPDVSVDERLKSPRLRPGELLSMSFVGMRWAC